MRHATVYAVEVLQHSPTRPSSVWEAAGLSWVAASDVSACDWAYIGPEDAFRSTTAAALLSGTAVDMPTCPACAALVDLALELRGL